jgi:E3 ubiquitin-protein ligase SHPRH
MSKDRTAGEMVAGEDLWACLFGHVAQSQRAAAPDERHQDPAVMGFFAASAAEDRRRGGQA